MTDEEKKGTKSSRRKARKKASKILARRKKEFTFKGHTVEELKKLSHEEVMDLLPSRARRNMIRMSKGLREEHEKFLKKLRKEPDKVHRTHLRNMIILPEMVGRKVSVYFGKDYKEVEIQPEMIGHYLGEFALTRTFQKHAGPGVGATRSSKYMPLK
jgi:small subunit ribosomal protein S19